MKRKSSPNGTMKISSVIRPPPDEELCARIIRVLSDRHRAVRGTAPESTCGNASERSDREPPANGPADVRERPLGGHPPAGGALDEPELQQVRLDDVFDRVGLLPHRCGEGRESDRPTGELP